jgi:membrane protein DedA with SNARE-associated domain
MLTLIVLLLALILIVLVLGRKGLVWAVGLVLAGIVVLANPELQKSDALLGVAIFAAVIMALRAFHQWRRNRAETRIRITR